MRWEDKSQSQRELCSLASCVTFENPCCSLNALSTSRLFSFPPHVLLYLSALQLQSMLSNVEEEGTDADSVIAPTTVGQVRKSPTSKSPPPKAPSPPRQRVFTRTRPPRRGGEESTEDEEMESRPPLPWKKSMYDTLSSDEQG